MVKGREGRIVKEDGVEKVGRQGKAGLGSAVSRVVDIFAESFSRHTFLVLIFPAAITSIEAPKQFSTPHPHPTTLLTSSRGLPPPPPYPVHPSLFPFENSHWERIPSVHVSAGGALNTVTIFDLRQTRGPLRRLVGLHPQPIHSLAVMPLA